MKNDPATAIGLALTYYRDRAGMSVRQAAEAIGTGHAHLNRIENGHHDASVPFLIRCARAYGITLRQVLKRSGLI